MNQPIMRELAHHAYFKAQLAERFPDADDETLRDTLEGLTDLREMIMAVARSQQEDRTLAQALRARMEEMQERLRRFDHRVERKRDLLATVMERAEIGKIAECDLTISLRQSPPPLVVADEDAIGKEYWKTQPPKLDRRKLLDDLKSGADVPGACLGNGGQSISVRVK
jgi:hypothetical protein